MTAGIMNKKAVTNSTRDFFIPDLCQVQAVFFLVLVAELLAIVLTLTDGGLQAFVWHQLSLISLFVQWSVLLSAALICPLRNWLSTWSLAPAAALCYLLIIAVVAATSISGQWLLQGAFTGSGNWFINGWELLTHIIICAVLAGIALRYFYLSYQLRMKEQAELQARIQALQSRIRPHFLFNSMNIIASLIAVDQEAAEIAVEDLAGLFRASLDETDTEVSLADELELCRRYARIEQLRLGDRLHIEWQLDGVPTTIKIPSLSLQPLLENAIYHGIQQLEAGGRVIISGTLDGDLLKLAVSNPLGKGRPETEGNQLAQDNIRHRLQAIYGSRAGLLATVEGDSYRAELFYPLESVPQ
ncbi:MAG: two-component system sensor histidine kinase AlgZ [Oceanicoccus sp.]|jgi:two-component system sensor histidine kinase AlgZ